MQFLKIQSIFMSCHLTDYDFMYWVGLHYIKVDLKSYSFLYDNFVISLASVPLSINTENMFSKTKMSILRFNMILIIVLNVIEIFT